jgi:hypothetical protein
MKPQNSKPLRHSHWLTFWVKSGSERKQVKISGFQSESCLSPGGEAKSRSAKGRQFFWSSTNGHVGAMSYQDLRFPVSDSRTPKLKPASRQNGNDISFNTCTSCFPTLVQLLSWVKDSVPVDPIFRGESYS